MSKPASVAEFGTVVPGTMSLTSVARHGRFVDVKTYVAGQMPVVKSGEVYEDLDPRCTGRLVQVLKTSGGRALVRTVAPRTCAPRTTSTTQKDTMGSVSWISLRRFTENARGFRLVRNSTVRSVQAILLGARLAAGCGIAMRNWDVRTADALIGLLGNRLAHEYLDDVLDDEGCLDSLHVEGGLADLLLDALEYAGTDGLVGEWQATEVASKGATRRIAGD